MKKISQKEGVKRVKKVVNLVQRIHQNSTVTASSTAEKKVTCEQCNDRGIVIIDGSMAKICHCQEQRRLERLFKSSQITPAFKNKTFSNFDITNCTSTVKNMFNCARSYVLRF